jgi:hypothetical protein
LPYADHEAGLAHYRKVHAEDRKDPEWQKKNKVWQRQYRFSHSDKRREYNARWRKARYLEVIQKLGGACYLQRLTPNKDWHSGTFHIHNVFGREHQGDYYVYERRIDEFVLLCRHHHRIVHMVALNMLGIGWEEFLERWTKTPPKSEVKVTNTIRT